MLSSHSGRPKQNAGSCLQWRDQDWLQKTKASLNEPAQPPSFSSLNFRALHSPYVSSPSFRGHQLHFFSSQSFRDYLAPHALAKPHFFSNPNFLQPRRGRWYQTVSSQSCRELRLLIASNPYFRVHRLLHASNPSYLVANHCYPSASPNFRVASLCSLCASRHCRHQQGQAQQSHGRNYFSSIVGDLGSSIPERLRPKQQGTTRRKWPVACLKTNGEYEQVI